MPFENRPQPSAQCHELSIEWVWALYNCSLYKSIVALLLLAASARYTIVQYINQSSHFYWLTAFTESAVSRALCVCVHARDNATQAAVRLSGSSRPWGHDVYSATLHNLSRKCNITLCFAKRYLLCHYKRKRRNLISIISSYDLYYHLVNNFCEKSCQ